MHPAEIYAFSVHFDKYSFSTDFSAEFCKAAIDKTGKMCYNLNVYSKGTH